MPESEDRSKQQQEYQQILNKLNKLLASRDRSVAEVRQRLLAEGFSSDGIEKAIRRARECELLDDRRFTQSFINGKKNLGWGCRKIEAGLMRLGIELRSLPGYPDEYFDREDELRRALNSVTKSRSRAKNQYQAQFRHLISRGYSAEIAQKAISQLTLTEPRNTI